MNLWYNINNLVVTTRYDNDRQAKAIQNKVTTLD